MAIRLLPKKTEILKQLTEKEKQEQEIGWEIQSKHKQIPDYIIPEGYENLRTEETFLNMEYERDYQLLLDYYDNTPNLDRTMISWYPELPQWKKIKELQLKKQIIYWAIEKGRSERAKRRD